MRDEFFARSASDKTDDWPAWFIARKSNPRLNVMHQVTKLLGLDFQGATMGSRPHMELLAASANEAEAARASPAPPLLSGDR